MAISSGDLTNMRAANQTCIPHLNITPKVIIGTAQINQSVFNYPIGTLTVDNVSLNGALADLSAVPVGSLVWIGTTAGAHDVMTTVVRKTCGAATLYIAGMGRGDPGVAVDDATELDDDQYITILAVKPPWGILSRIYNSVFYKAFDVAYTDQGSSPAPVCNIGPWKRLSLTGASVAVTLTNAAVTDVKPASFAWGAATISSYSWSLRNESYGTTGGSFDATNAEAATVTFTAAGFYIVYCTITDSAGKTHTAETYIWVVDGSTETDTAGWLIQEDRQTREGRQMTLVLNGGVAESAVFPGAGFLYTETQEYNDNTVTAGATVDTFAGWANDERPARTVQHGRVEFDVLSPSLLLKSVPAAPQYIQEATSPANWTEVTSTLSNPNGVIWYILQHHCPAMLQVFDYDPLVDASEASQDSSLRDHIWTVTSRSIWGQLREILPHQINAGCRSSGALVVRHNPQLMDDTDRAALDSRMTWFASDIREELVMPQTHRLKTGMVDAYAFSYSGGGVATPYWSRAPGDAQANGVDLQTINGMVVPASGAQATLNRVSGHLFAQANNPTPQLTVKAMRNMDTADPALMVWHALTISSTLDPRGRGYTGKRMIPLQVTRNWQQSEDGIWLKQIDIVFELETSGVAGTTKAIPVSSQSDWDPFGDWSDGFFDFGWITDGFVIDPFNFGNEEAVMAAFADDGYMYTTQDFGTPAALGGPTWAATDLSALGLTGTPKQFVVDAFSYEDGGGIDGWLFTTTGIYKIDNIFGAPPTITEQHTWSITWAAGDQVNADASFAEQGFVVAGLHDNETNCYAVYTSNGGTTWTENNISTSDSEFSGCVPLVYVSSKTPGRAYVAGIEPGTGGPSDVTYDFELGQYGFTIDPSNPTYGVYVSSSGFESRYCLQTGGGDWGERIWIKQTFDPPLQLTYAKITMDADTDGSWQGYLRIYADGNKIADAGFTGQNEFAETIWYGTPLEVTTLEVRSSWSSSSEEEKYMIFKTLRIVSTSDGTDPYGKVFETNNYGTNWSGTTKTLGESLGGDIDVPWNSNDDETTLMYGRKPDGSGSVFWTNGSTSASITPSQGAGTWTPVRGRWCLESCTADNGTLLLTATDGSGNYATFYSTDSGSSWTEIVASTGSTATYLRGAIGPVYTTLYLWGDDGRIAWSGDGGTTIDSRIGNMSGYSPGEIVGICGGG